MPEPQGAVPAVEAYHRGTTLSSQPFVRTQSTHLSLVLGGSKSPHWAWHLPVCLLLGQTIRFQKSLKDLRHEKRGSLFRAGAKFALASVTPTSQYMLLLFRNMATSKNETGFIKWKLSNKTCKHPTRTPPTSHYQVLMFENKLSSHKINKS